MQRVSPESNITTNHSGPRRRRDGDSNQESAPPKRQRKIPTVRKQRGFSHDGGQQFEVKMATVIGLRGMVNGDIFKLYTNRPECGNFDDLVYKTNRKSYFLQLKHTDNPDKEKLTKREVAKLLLKCFESYCQILNEPKIKDNSYENSEFIIYTNKQLGPELLRHRTQPRDIDLILKTSDEGEIFSFNPDMNKKIDIYTLVENLAKGKEEFKDSSGESLRSKLSELSKFIETVVIATGQKENNEIDLLIHEEIRNGDAIKMPDKEYKSIFHHIVPHIENWWRMKKEPMEPALLTDWLRTGKTENCKSVVTSLSETCKNKIFETGIKFSPCEISRLQAELSNKRAVHLRSDELTLCSVILLDCLPASERIFVTFECLQKNEDMLLHAWLGGDWEWLIVTCDSTVKLSKISDTCRKIIKRVSSSKRVIILTQFSTEKITDFDTVRHEFSFVELSSDAQDLVLDKEVNFQGFTVTMRSMLPRNVNLKYIFLPELVTDLITEESPIKIGGRCLENEGSYVPRILEREVCLNLEKTPKSYHTFVVSGTTSEGNITPVNSAAINNPTDIVTELKKNKSSRIFMESKEDEEITFMEETKKNEVKPVHSVEYNNGKLLWKMSSCGSDSLLDCMESDEIHADKNIIRDFIRRGSSKVKEESIWDLNERRVLVVAEPGMGKSSTTTSVAWNTKKRDPASWVLRINWNDHTKKLQKINETNFSFDSLVEFLCNAAFPESKYKDTEKLLLKYALQESGNVTVLMDGFDEICPTHAERATVILSELMKNELCRIWVTSRAVEKDRLEKVLYAPAFNIKALSHKCQEDMLRKLWTNKAGKKESELFEFITTLLSSFTKSVYDDKFTGCPLYITMIATVFEEDMETYLNSRGGITPRIDLVNLYERFVEMKLHICFTDKEKADLSNPCSEYQHDKIKEKYLTDFEKSALLAILPPHILKLLNMKKIKQKTKRFLDEVLSGRDKTGIVMNVVEGKPQFIHRTFAEYFTARWFSNNFTGNRKALKRLYFDSSYRIVRDMFDRMLAKDRPLHCAVLESDKERFRTLVEEGFDISALDKGGRTAMHLIRTNNLSLLDNIKCLPNCKIYLEIKDSILQWTPDEYAWKNKDYDVVDQLLKLTGKIKQNA